MMMLIVFLAILVLSILFPRSRKVALLAMAFMLVMYCFVRYKGDLEIYQWIYEDYGVNLSGTTFEPGFTLLIIICKKLGMPFIQYRIVLGLIYVLLLNRGVSQLNEYRALALTISAFFPFFIFTSVLRSGIACVIILNGYRYLIDPAYGRGGLVRYALLVLLAATFHYSAALMIVFVLARMRLNPAKLMRYLVVVIALTILLNHTDIIYDLLSKITSREKLLQWFVRGEATANLTGTFAILIVLGVNFLLAARSRRLLSPAGTECGLYREEAQFVFNSSFLLFFFFPLMVFAAPFMRVAYMLMPLFIANTVNASFVNSRNDRTEERFNRRLSLQCIMLIVSMAVWKFYYDLPYIKAGDIPLQELLRTRFWFG